MASLDKAQDKRRTSLWKHWNPRRSAFLQRIRAGCFSVHARVGMLVDHASILRLFMDCALALIFQQTRVSSSIRGRARQQALHAQRKPTEWRTTLELAPSYTKRCCGWHCTPHGRFGRTIGNGVPAPPLILSDSVLQE